MKEIDFLPFLFIGLFGSLLAKITEIIFKVALKTPVAPSWEISFLLIVSTIISIFIYILGFKKLFNVIFIPILYYFIKEVINVYIVLGTPLTLFNSIMFLTLVVEPLIFGMFGGTVSIWLGKKVFKL